MNELKKFITISKYAGARFDLIQAGGGNTSVKIDNNEMYIKASGFLLSEVDEKKGYSLVKTKETASITSKIDKLKLTSKKDREKKAQNLLEKCLLKSEFPKPSIETYMHAILKQYTLHTHPILVNAITCQGNWKKILSKLFGNKILLINYFTPGIDLAIGISNEYENFYNSFKEYPEIIFLQNHGLIITSDEYNAIEVLNEYVLDKISQYLKVDISKYKLVTNIANLVNGVSYKNFVAYVSEDKIIYDIYKNNKKIFYSPPFYPDKLVFNGVKPVEINSLNDNLPIIKYFNQYKELPKIILFDEKIFFIALNIKKSKEMEEVFKFHLLTQYLIKEKKINYLPLDELMYLGKWEAEKYRQNL